MNEEMQPSMHLNYHRRGALMIHLLNRCNLACQHCYMDAANFKETYLPYELVISAIGETNELGIGSLFITGGEPFLHPDFQKILAFAGQQDHLITQISTNGTQIGSEEASWLKKSRAQIQISIDGPEEFHDHFRQLPGAFQRSSRAISCLVEAGVHVTIVMTVTQDNWEHLPWLVHWAAEHGVKHFSIQPLLAYGRGVNIHDRKLSYDQMSHLFMQLSDLGYAYRSRGLELGLTSYRLKAFLQEHPCAAYVCNGLKCHRQLVKELKKLVIREDGVVLPEIATIDYKFALGNLKEDTLKEMIRRYFEEDGYTKFHQFCRSIFDEIVPTWSEPLIPWDEIVSGRSKKS